METNLTIKLNRCEYNLKDQIVTDNSTFSEIWRAWSDDQNKVVVLKTIKRKKFFTLSTEVREGYLKHLHNEIDFLKSMQGRPSPNVIQMIDSGIWEGLPVIVLPFMQENLDSFLKSNDQPIALKQRLSWCLQIAKGLSAIHSQGFHYRDLKLSNILTDQGGAVLKLADFGTVKINDRSNQHSFVGTLPKMAPEQLLPSDRIDNSDGQNVYVYDTDHRTDFFSLGLILFELITGRDTLLSQGKIHKLRLNVGAQGLWEQRNKLGGISEQELGAFQAHLQRYLPGEEDDDATFVREEQLGLPADCILLLTELLGSLLARDKNSRPDNAEEIIDSLSQIFAALPGPVCLPEQSIQIKEPGDKLVNRFLSVPVLGSISVMVLIGGLLLFSNDIQKHIFPGPVSLKGPNEELPIKEPETSEITKSKKRSILPDQFPYNTMVIVKPDSFVMGNSDKVCAKADGCIDEQPAHPVKLKPFAVMAQLITERQLYQLCVESGGHCSDYNLNSDRPVDKIDKLEVLDLIAQLSSAPDLKLRLLSEAEWEYLATYTSFINPTHLEWLEDCAHVNYLNAPKDGVAWLGMNQGNCVLSAVRGLSTQNDIHNRIFFPVKLKKDNLGFRLAVSLPKHENE